MKTFATIQFVLAATCAIVLVLPNLWMIGSVFSATLAGNHSLIFLALLLVVVWWCGLWLLVGYWNAINNKPQESPNLWTVSVVFNSVGFLLGVVFMANSPVSLELWLVLIPSFAGAVLGIIALFLPSQTCVSKLETKHVHS
jgi:hypothetical protein